MHICKFSPKFLQNLKTSQSLAWILEGSLFPPQFVLGSQSIPRAGGRREGRINIVREKEFHSPVAFPILSLCHPCLMPQTDEGCRHHRLREALRPCQVQALNLPLELLGLTRVVLSYQTLVTATASQERKQRCLISCACIRWEGELFSLGRGHRLVSPRLVGNKRDQLTALSRLEALECHGQTGAQELREANRNRCSML